MLISVLFTWIWNNSGRSMAAMLVFHAMFNLAHWVFPVIENDTAGQMLFVAQFALVIGIVALFGPARLVRRVGGRRDANGL